MSESEHHAHHSKPDSMSQYVLPASILLASVILALAMTSAATTLVEGGVGGTVTVPTVPTVPNPDQGDLGVAPTTGQTMSALLANAPGKWGSSSAEIIIVEYSDYQCPFCQRHEQQTQPQILSTFVDTGIVEFGYKDFPLSNIHPQAEPLARAARCAGDQDMYEEMHGLIFSSPLASSSAVTPETMSPWVTSLGLDAGAFASCFNAGTYADAVQADFVEGQGMGISGTPSFAIGLRGEEGGLIVGACPYDAFETAIQAIQDGKSWQQVPNSCTILVS